MPFLPVFANLVVPCWKVAVWNTSLIEPKQIDVMSFCCHRHFKLMGEPATTCKLEYLQEMSCSLSFIELLL